VKGALVLLAAVAALAGCGGSSKQAATTSTVSTPPPPGPGKVLYAGGPWAVVLRNGVATAYHLVGERWQADRAGAVRIDILGPQPGQTVAPIPQVAIQMTAKTPLIESGLWVDGRELEVKGGGIKPEQGTIYGAPAAKLAPGVHRAVGYGRTDVHGTAVAWTFRVRG
jgi:hypothetical protein